jgi:APA family basic amino acid/polyamine antiporter
MASEQSAMTQTHFARRATGFVRDVKVRDAVIFNVLPACPGLVMAVSIFWVLSVFSQVNVYIAILITAVCSFVISGAFGLLSQIMPRSGADYILISRSLHPALAVGSSILIGTSSMIAMGYWGVFTAKICIGPMLTMTGVAADSTTLQDWGTTVTSNGWSMAIGLIEIGLLALVMAYGMRLMMRVQLWLFALGSVGFLVAAIVLLTTSQSSFISSYNDYARPFTHRADTYHFFIAKAHEAGVNLSGGTDWHNTIVASGAFIAFGVWVWFSTNLAGEIRQAGTRKNWYSMLGGLALTFIPIVVMVALLYHTVGQTFLTAVNGISGDPTVYTLPNAPWWITLVAAIHTNTLFVAFLGLTFVAWAPLIVYIQIVQPVRALFAW